jgi:ribosomal protein S10
MQESEDHIVIMLKVEDEEKIDKLLEFVHSIQTATSMRIVGPF